VRAGPQFSDTETPPRGLSGLRPAGSGSSDSSRIPNDRCLSLATVCKREPVSTDFPRRRKKTGPSRGANFSGEPTSTFDVLCFNCSELGPAGKRRRSALFVILLRENLFNTVAQTRVCAYFHLWLFDNFFPCCIFMQRRAHLCSSTEWHMHRQHQLPGSYCCRVVPVSAKEASTTITAEMNLRFTFIA
jgi:hypothetical protein